MTPPWKMLHSYLDLIVLNVTLIPGPPYSDGYNRALRHNLNSRKKIEEFELMLSKVSWQNRYESRIRNSNVCIQTWENECQLEYFQTGWRPSFWLFLIEFRVDLLAWNDFHLDFEGIESDLANCIHYAHYRNSEELEEQCLQALFNDDYFWEK